MMTAIEIPDYEITKYEFLLNRYRNKKLRTTYSNRIVVFDKDGFDAFSAFHIEQITNQPVKTKHPRILQALNTAWNSLEDWVDCVARDFSQHLITSSEIEGRIQELKYPTWISIMVHKRKRHYWGDAY